MHPWACANLSHMYSIGDGVDKNQQEAEKYKRLAKKYSGRELRIWNYIINKDVIVMSLLSETVFLQWINNLKQMLFIWLWKLTG